MTATRARTAAHVKKDGTATSATAPALVSGAVPVREVRRFLST